MKLSRFLTERAEDILVQWEAFAKTLEPAAASMTSVALRDHAQQMIRAIALDIESLQSSAEQITKSHGEGPAKYPQSAASLHGRLREVSGFSLVQLTAEFRALRASVLRLWLPNIGEFTEEVHEELVRFNEAVDQALAESAVTFSEHNNQTRERLAILGHDLRTPLAAISMTGHLLVRSTSSEGNPATGKRLLRSAAAMSTMVNDLLEYSRTQLGGKMPIAPAPANMENIIKAALHDAASAYPDCVFDFHSHGDLSGVFDDVRMQQVVLNLLAIPGEGDERRARRRGRIRRHCPFGDQLRPSHSPRVAQSHFERHGATPSRRRAAWALANQPRLRTICRSGDHLGPRWLDPCFIERWRGHDLHGSDSPRRRAVKNGRPALLKS